MDLLRLALERGRTAREAVEVCCSLLESHGQGGGCAEGDDSWTYENGFLFADGAEAFVLETAGVRHWACERVLPGAYRNISNGLSIRSNIHSCSAGLQDVCRAKGWWDGERPFDWKVAVGTGGRTHANLTIYGREKAGKEHLTALASEAAAGKLNAADMQSWIRGMTKALRDDESGICFRDVHGFNSTGSQISWLPSEDKVVATHLFTCASDPLSTSYKRFAFPGAEAAATDHSSLELWRRHRTLALQGGLDRIAAADAVKQVRQGINNLEDSALQNLEGEVPVQDIGLAEAVASELELLVKATDGGEQSVARG